MLIVFYNSQGEGRQERACLLQGRGGRVAVRGTRSYGSGGKRWQQQQLRRWQQQHDSRSRSGGYSGTSSYGTSSSSRSRSGGYSGTSTAPAVATETAAAARQQERRLQRYQQLRHRQWQHDSSSSSNRSGDYSGISSYGSSSRSRSGGYSGTSTAPAVATETTMAA